MMTQKAVCGVRVPRKALCSEKLRFCEVYALNGGNGADAVRKAFEKWFGRDSQAVSVKAHKLLLDERIRSRISELQSRNAEIVQHHYGIAAFQILEELAKIGFSNMHDFIRFDERGTPILDFSRMTRDRFAAIKSMMIQQPEASSTSEPTPASGSNRQQIVFLKFKIVMHDKRAALVALGKNFGLWTAKKQERRRDAHLASRLQDAIARQRAHRRVLCGPAQAVVSTP